MASGSVSMAEFSLPDSVPHGQAHLASLSDMNGSFSPARSSPSAQSPASRRASSPRSSPALSSAKSDIEHPEHTQHSDKRDGSEVDAEGSDDEGLGGSVSLTRHVSPSTHSDNAPTLSSNDNTVNNAGTVKTGVNEHDYINEHADLFNLRRSGRARNTRMIVDSTDDDEESEPVVKRRRRTNGSTPAVSKTHTPRVPSSDEDEDSDDEEFYTNVRKQSTKKVKQRQKDVVNGVVPSSDFQRFSGRRKVTITTYNEFSDAEDIDEDDVAEWEEYDAEADAMPTIDLVLDFEVLDGHKMTDKTVSKNSFRYLVKWQEQAHYHATWYDLNDPQPAKVKGIRKLENYFDKVIKQFIWLDQNNASPDDREIMQIQFQQKQDEYETNRTIERIVGDRDGDETETEYFVKWTNVPYSGCSWETSDLVSELAPKAVDDYLNRATRIPHSNSANAWNRKPPRFNWIKQQPDYIKEVKMRDFQLHGLNFISLNWHKRKNVILADEMGLGKTVQTVAFISYLVHDMEQQGLHLCIVPLSTISAWQETFANWAPDLNVVVYTGAGREIIRDHEILIDGSYNKPKCNVILTTREMVKMDLTFFSKLQFQFVAVDEAHILKNPKALIYQQLLSLNIPAKLLITGTPMQNTIDELQALLDFLNPGEVECPADVESLPLEEKAEVLQKFKNAIRPYMLRRTKSEVETDLPPKTEKILRVPCSPLQKELAQAVLEKNYEALMALVESSGRKQNLLNVTMELRKISNHPFLMQNVEDRFLKGGESTEDACRITVNTSGKMTLLDRLLKKLKAEGHRVLIFTGHVSMLNLMSDYMNWMGYKFQRLDGTVPSTARRQAIDHFNKPGSDDFCFILSTRAGGLGINLATADRVILFDSDWNPHPDVQAMARAHRIGQTRPVEVYRLISKDTVDEAILEKARNKLIIESIIIQQGGGQDEQKAALAKHARHTEAPQTAADIVNMLKQGAAQMFKDDEESNNVEQLDINAILDQAEENKDDKKINGGQSSDGGLDFMKAMITSVQLEANWEDIIPKEKIAQIEAEEARRREEERLNQVEGKVRKRKAPAAFDGEFQREAKKRAKKIAVAQEDSDSALSELDEDSDVEKVKDPARPLSNKEWRLFTKAIEKHGGFNDYDASQKIIKEANLEGRASEVLTKAYDELVLLCKTAYDEAVQKAVVEGKPRNEIAKKERGAILVKHHSANRPLNAETIIDRANDMRAVRAAVSDCDSIETFRIPNANKSVKYSCEWTEREDAMLVVGIARHGFGGWVAIREDPELRLQDKLFLEENRIDMKNKRTKDEKKSTPGAIHLHRRATYLITVLKENEERKANGGPVARKKKAPRTRVSAIKNEAGENGSSSNSPMRPRSSSQSGIKHERPGSRGSNGSDKAARKAESELDRSHKKRRVSDEQGDDDRIRRLREEHQKKVEARRSDDRREPTHGHKYERRERSRSPYRREHRERSRSPRRDHYRERDDAHRKPAESSYRDERRRQYDRPRDDKAHRPRDDRPGSAYRNDANGHRHNNDHRPRDDYRSSYARPTSSHHRDRHDSRQEHREHRDRDRHHDPHRSHHRHSEDRRERSDSKPADPADAAVYEYLRQYPELGRRIDDGRAYIAKHRDDNNLSADDKQLPLWRGLSSFYQHMQKRASQPTHGPSPPSDDLWRFVGKKYFGKVPLDDVKRLFEQADEKYAAHKAKNT